ncbi:MAG: hypothetical protein ACR2PQ_09265 [Myxococcota bacterium]
MTRPLLRSVPLALLAAFVGCSSGVGFSTTVDPLAMFPREATYVWDEAGNSFPDEPRLDPLHLDTLLVEEVDRSLAERSYHRVAAEPADYRLAYEVRLNTRIEADHSRSLIIVWLNLAETSTGDLVWTGAMQTKLHVGMTEAERRDRLEEALDELLEDFPPDQHG